MCFPKVFASIFTTDAALIAFTKDALRYYLAALFMFGIQIACQMTFNALGNAPASILVAIMRKFVLLLPLISFCRISLQQIRRWLFIWRSRSRMCWR